jgi:hypothetical protein
MRITILCKVNENDYREQMIESEESDTNCSLGATSLEHMHY